MPSRSIALSTTSSPSRTHTSLLTPPLSSIPLQDGASERSMLQRYSSYSDASIRSSNGKRSPQSLLDHLESNGHGDDEIAEMAYVYSVRAAALSKCLGRDFFSERRGSSPIPSGSPKLGTAQLTLSPKSEISSPELPTKANSHNLSSRFRKKTDKRADETKLPRELLVEFWTTLSDAQGDEAWKLRVENFLKQVKKGTKTPSGMNLRYITVLLEAFGQTLPDPNPSVDHQTRLLQLLNGYLPRSSYFSPLARVQSQNDKDLLFRLREEIHSLLPSQQSTPNPYLGSASPRSAMSRTPRSSFSHADRDRTVDSEEVIETLSLLWGKSRTTVEGDLSRVEGRRSLDSVYLQDLKKELATLCNADTPLEVARQAFLTRQTAKLWGTTPTSARQSQAALSSSPSPSFRSDDRQDQSYFIPPLPTAAFSHLNQLAPGDRSTWLVDFCRDLWGVPTDQQLTLQIQLLHERWSASLGGADEVPAARALAEVATYWSELHPQPERLPSELETVAGESLDLLESALKAIFPLNGQFLAPAPPSVLTLLLAGDQVLICRCAGKLQTRVEELKDQLRWAAVQEYVLAAQSGRTGNSGGVRSMEQSIELAGWIEQEIQDVRRAWGSGQRRHFDPANIILTKQLPLYFAELHELVERKGHTDMFELYDSCARLVELWKVTCPGQELGFDLHAFFEPHVRAWLKETDHQSMQEWVMRAISMDNWHPQGVDKHSQSVTDLFGFINGAITTVLELPLSEYRKSIYLVDLSKIISQAVRNYASSLYSLFLAEVVPPPPSGGINEIQQKIGGKAGSWIAKGQQMAKSRSSEKKEQAEFILPETVIHQACTKLMNIKASQEALCRVMTQIGNYTSLNTASKVKSSQADLTTAKITVVRGTGITMKGSNKAADAFVIVSERNTGERLIKTKTILNSDKPTWGEAFEIYMTGNHQLQITAFDRQLVGKHDVVGSTTISLDPKTLSLSSISDMDIPLDPRGTLHLRIEHDGAGGGDARQYLDDALHVLDNTEKDMCLKLIDAVCLAVGSTLTMGHVTAMAKMLKDKKGGKRLQSNYDDSEMEMERSLAALFDSLHANFYVLGETTDKTTRSTLVLEVWNTTLEALTSLLVPPLSDQSSTSRKSLSPAEMDVILKYLQLIKAFFLSTEAKESHDPQIGPEAMYGVTTGQVQNSRYRDILILGQCIDLPSEALKSRCAGAVKSALAIGWEQESRKEDQMRSAETLLRLVRTRPDLAVFLSQQYVLMHQSRMQRSAMRNIRA